MASAIDQIQLHWRTIEAAGWQLSGVNLLIDWRASGPSELALEVAALQAGDYHFEQLRFSCSQFEWSTTAIQCPQGQLGLTGERFDAEAVPVSASYHIDSRELTFSVAALPLAGGQVHVAFHRRSGGWDLSADLSETMLAGVAELLATAGVKIPAFDYQGRISG